MTFTDLYYSVPLIFAVSLVYAATRHEEVVPILGHALRVGMWIGGAMVAVFGVLFLVSWRL